MIESRNFFASRTNWATFAACIIGVLPIFGVHLSDSQTGAAAQAVAALGACGVALYGRVKAGAKPLKLFGILIMTAEHAAELLNAMPPSAAAAPWSGGDSPAALPPGSGGAREAHHA